MMRPMADTLITVYAKENNMGLRPYQQRIVDDAMDGYTDYTRQFVVDAFQACLAGDTKIAN